MPFHEDWYVQDHVVKVELYGELTAEDIAQAFQATRKRLNNSQADRVHIIHDWSKIQSYPTILHEIRRALSQSGNQSLEKIGWVVVYGTEQEHLRFLGDLIFQYFKLHAHMTDTMETALAFLKQREASLQPVLDEYALTHVHWQLPGHILYCYNILDSNHLAMRNRNAYNLIMREGKPPYVHMLIDYSTTLPEEYHTNVRKLIQRADSTPEFQKARDDLVQHPLFGWVVAIGVTGRNIQLTGTILATRFNYRRKEVETVEDALMFLKQVDPNIARILKSP